MSLCAKTNFLRKCATLMKYFLSIHRNANVNNGRENDAIHFYRIRDCMRLLKYITFGTTNV